MKTSLIIILSLFAIFGFATAGKYKTKTDFLEAENARLQAEIDKWDEFNRTHVVATALPRLEETK